MNHNIATEARATRALAAIVEVEAVAIIPDDPIKSRQLILALAEARANVREIIDGCQAAERARLDEQRHGRSMLR